MLIKNMKISDIRPYEKNPRFNDDAVDAVAKSIREFGWRAPIVVDSDMVIICGHTRLKAAIKLGLEEVPVHVATDLTPEQVQAYRIADNKTGEIAEWNFDMLPGELQDLKDAEFDLSLLGFDADELAQLLNGDTEDTVAAGETDPDAVPEEPETAASERGKIYQLGSHRLMCGDSTDPGDVAALMAGAKASFVFTDPPWNVNYGAVESGNPQGYKPRTILNDFMGTEDFKNFMLKAFRNMKDFSEPGAMIYVVMSAQEWGNMMLTLAMNDFHWSSTIIWNKDRLVLSRKDYHTKYEPIWYGWSEGEARLHPLEDRKQSDVWDIPRPSKSDDHPTMKPVELVVRAIQNSSDRSALVLDLFGGSGTTLIACEQTGRTGFAMELDPKYCDVIRRRWAEFRYGEGCDWQAKTPEIEQNVEEAVNA